MSANQRRSGFRLPWLADEDEPEAPASAAGDVKPEPAVADAPASTSARADGAPAVSDTAPAADAPPAVASGNGTTAHAPAAASSPQAESAPDPSAAASSHAPPPAPSEPPDAFIRDLVAAMRTVADEARTSGVERLKADAEEAVRTLEADAEKRRQDLRERAEADINGVGEWARAEAERIKVEAEQRVASRRAQLEQQLAAEGTRAEAEAKALRDRVSEYERQLEAFHAQLSEINDPAAFAAAAKRMPAAPTLRPGGEAAAGQAAVPAATGAPPDPSPDPATVSPGAQDTAAEPPADHATAAESATAEAEHEVHPAEEEVLAARLAELDEELEAPDRDPAPAPANAAATSPADGPEVTTDIVVKGLGSFGAITGFRQSLSSQPGVSAVALSLGQSGEFVFRATHAPGFDLGAAIRSMEGDGASVEPRPEGGMRVTLERSR